MKTYTLSQNGISFTGQLVDTDDPKNTRPVSLAGGRSYVKFRLPDGRTVKKEAHAAGTVIVYSTGGGSMRDVAGGDVAGDWYYTVGSVLLGKVRESPYWRMFWVVM